MPKTRQQKVDIVGRMKEKIARSKAMVFTSVAAFTIKDADGLREKGRALQVESSVTKKNLLLIALKEAGYMLDEQTLPGSILTSFSYGDEVSAAKMLAEFAKGRDTIKIAGGILEGRFVDAKSVKQLATLPSREQLLGQLVGAINAPRSGFVQVLAGNLRALVGVLNNVAEAKGKAA